MSLFNAMFGAAWVGMVAMWRHWTRKRAVIGWKDPDGKGRNALDPAKDRDTLALEEAEIIAGSTCSVEAKVHDGFFWIWGLDIPPSALPHVRIEKVQVGPVSLIRAPFIGSALNNPRAMITFDEYAATPDWPALVSIVNLSDQILSTKGWKLLGRKTYAQAPKPPDSPRPGTIDSLLGR